MRNIRTVGDGVWVHDSIECDTVGRRWFRNRSLQRVDCILECQLPKAEAHRANWGRSIEGRAVSSVGISPRPSQDVGGARARARACKSPAGKSEIKGGLMSVSKI
jgi:hypothetical protein